PKTLDVFRRIRNGGTEVRIRPLGMVAVTVTLVGLAVAAVAFGPANFANLGSPTGGNTPQASSIGTPTWHVGDTWTYHVNSTPPDVFVAGPPWGSPSPEGTLTPAGASPDAPQYNVTVHGSLHPGSGFDAARDGGYPTSSTLVLYRPAPEDAPAGGSPL